MVWRNSRDASLCPLTLNWNLLFKLVPYLVPVLCKWVALGELKLLMCFISPFYFIPCKWVVFCFSKKEPKGMAQFKRCKFVSTHLKLELVPWQPRPDTNKKNHGTVLVTIKTKVFRYFRVLCHQVGIRGDVQSSWHKIISSKLWHAYKFCSCLQKLIL